MRWDQTYVFTKFPCKPLYYYDIITYSFIVELNNIIVLTHIHNTWYLKLGYNTGNP